MSPITTPERIINPSSFSGWKRLVRVTAWILRFIENLRTKRQLTNKDSQAKKGPLSPKQLERSTEFWVKEAQKPLHERLETNELKILSPFVDEKRVIRVGGRVNEAVTSYETKHPILLPNKHRISYLITKEAHQIGHTGVVTTAAKTRRIYWIMKVHDLAKLIKNKCVSCHEMQPKLESQMMANLVTYSR